MKHLICWLFGHKPFAWRGSHMYGSEAVRIVATGEHFATTYDSRMMPVAHIDLCERCHGLYWVASR